MSMTTTQQTLTAEQLETLAVVESTEATEADVRAARAFLERFNYSATALTALSIAMAEMENEVGDTTDAAASQLLLRTACELAPIDALVA